MVVSFMVAVPSRRVGVVRSERRYLNIPIVVSARRREVTEVMNGPDDVYVERKGRLEKVTDGLFEGEEAVLHVIERIVAPLGLRVDESSPWVDARLSDGSRVQTRTLRTPFAHDVPTEPRGCLSG
jgi:pilus assembly protein CpaF